MDRICVVIIILCLVIGGYSCGRSNEKFEEESKVKEEARTLESDAYKGAEDIEKDAKALKKDVTQAAKGAEKDLKVLEEEKVIEKEMGKEEKGIPAPEADWDSEPIQQEP